MSIAEKNNLICSWSGGKDSCLALYKTKQFGRIPKFLFTMFIENGSRSRCHGLSRQILQTQAKLLNITMITISTSWENYSANFTAHLKKIKEKNDDIGAVVFGDIDIIGHKTWSEEICARAGLKALTPLWQIDRKTLLREFLELNFTAIIVAVDAKKMSPNYLGKTLDKSLYEEFVNLGIDICGENGEYHTVVVDGPIFKNRLSLEKLGEPVLHSGYWFQDFIDITCN